MIRKAPQKSILITGCSTGIGYVCALGMRDRGWRVFATARTSDALANLTSQGLEAMPPPAAKVKG